VGGCALKDSDFFASVDDLPPLGLIAVTVTGDLSTVPVTVTGPGYTRTQDVGTTAVNYGGIPLGGYGVVPMPPTGYTCLPLREDLTLTAAQPTRQVAFTCSEILVPTGTLTFTTTGLSGSTMYPLSVSGAASFTGMISASSTIFDPAPAGNYDWMLNLGATAEHSCDPASGTATVQPQQDLVIFITCQPLPGTVSVQVTGLGTEVASVAWTGPASGSGAYGSTPGQIPGLAPGSYTFTITEPFGATCSPSSVPVTVAAAGSESVVFTCAAALVDLSIDISAVPSGAFTNLTLPLRDGGGTQRGSIQMTRQGANSFTGSNPFRLGFGDGATAFLQVTGLVVDGTPFAAVGVTFTTDNTPLNGTNFIEVGYLDGTLVPISTDQVTTANTSYWGTAPGGTQVVGIRTSGTGFFADLLDWGLVGTRQF
jgi:hypothetical protein